MYCPLLMFTRVKKFVDFMISKLVYACSESKIADRFYLQFEWLIMQTESELCTHICELAAEHTSCHPWRSQLLSLALMCITHEFRPKIWKRQGLRLYGLSSMSTSRDAGMKSAHSDIIITPFWVPLQKCITPQDLQSTWSHNCVSQKLLATYLYPASCCLPVVWCTFSQS